MTIGNSSDNYRQSLTNNFVNRTKRNVRGAIAALAAVLALATVALYPSSSIAVAGKLLRGVSSGEFSMVKPNRVMNVTGKTGNQSPASQEDKVNDAIRAAGDLNVERRGHSAVALADGRLLVIGGQNENGAVAEAEIYDPASRSFTLATRSIVARADFTATKLADGRILVAGGRNSDGPLSSTEIYDPAAQSFYHGPALNAARAGHSATMLADGRILIAGGAAEGSAEIFDPASQTSIHIEARLDIARKAHSATLLRNGKVLIAGGVNSGGDAIQSAELFDPATMNFTDTSNAMRVARTRPTLRVLPDGKVQVIGGDDGATMEMFNIEGEYFTAYAHLQESKASHSESLNAQTRAALIQRANTRQKRSGNNLSNALDSMLDRRGYSLNEIPDANQSMLTGGVKSSGVYLKSTVLLATSSATITTDKTDYAPGDTAIINGAGFGMGDTITLQALHTDGTPNTGAGHEPWTVIDGGVGDEDGVADGSFMTRWYVDPDDSANSTFRLTASGDPSGRTAETTFTDTSSQITQIRFNTVDQASSFIVGVPNAGVAGTNSRLRVQTLDSSSAAETVTGSGQSVTVQVTSNTSSGRFDTSNGGAFTATSLTLLIPQSSQNTPDFFYRDTTAGMVTLTATVTAKTIQLTSLPIGAAASITKTVNKANTTTTVASNANPACAGQTITFTATVAHANANGAGAPTGAVIFKDGVTTIGAGTLNTSGGVTTATFSVSSLTAGAHSVTAAYSGDSNFNSSASSAITQIVTSAPNAPSTTGASHCGTGSVTLTASGVGGMLKWYSDAGLTTQVAMGPSFITPSLSATTTYYVAETNAAGCVSPASPVTATINSLPTATVTGNAFICAGGSTTLSVTLTGAAPWTITWSDGFTQNGVTANPATRTVSPSSTTTYSVTSVTDGANCPNSGAGNATVTVNTKPALNSSGPFTIAWGANLSFTATASDPNAGQMLTFSLIGAPAGASVTAGGAFSWTPTSAQIGAHNFKARVTDPCGAYDEKYVSVSVGKRATMLAYNGATSGQYSDQVVFSATLTDAGGGAMNGMVLASKVVGFTVGTQSAGGATSGSGVASANLVLNQAAGPYSVISLFAGDSLYLGSGDSDPFTIGKEKTETTYTGDAFVYTSGPNVSTAPVALSAHLAQEADGYPGNITLAKVRFELFKAGNLSMTPDQSVNNVPVNSAGDALISVNLGVENWTVMVKIEPANVYWKASPIGISAITVALGSSEKRVTGGGWIPDSGSANGKGNFGFTVSYQKNGSPKGSSIYVFRGLDGYDYVIKSNSWQSGGLSFTNDPTKASFSGKCVVQKIDPVTGLLVASYGNYSFIVNIVDGDLLNPRQSDKYAITALDNNQVWRQLGTPVSPLTLGGGNVAIKSK